MKQNKIFIVQPSASLKLPTISPDFPEFSSENELRLERIDIKQKLREFVNISVRPSQISGLFIFGFDTKQQKYAFVWFSLPTACTFLKLIVIIGGMFYAAIYEVMIHKRLGVENGENTTLGTTELLLTFTFFASDALGIILFWRNRGNVEDFLNSIEDTLVTFATELKDHTWVDDWFYHTSRRCGWLVMTVGASAAIAFLITSYPDLLSILAYFQGKEELNWFICTFPIFSYCWYAILFRRLHFRILLMTLIDTLQFGFRSVKEHATEFANAKGIGGIGDVRIRRVSGDIDEKGAKQDDITVIDYLKEIKLRQILEKYRSMELLLDEFNDLFAPHLLSGIFSMVVVLLMSLFHLFVEVEINVFNRFALIFGMNSLCNFVTLFYLGTSATEMATEADASITAVKDIPLSSINPILKQKVMLHFQQALAVPLVVSPGGFFSLNREMLTSVAGALTTYLIVLIQFRGSEKISSSSALRNQTTPLTNVMLEA
ncbi:unnamed protein product [Orchesella dallaii]|uniref:Gustatory receptor n=1 Tax=Orchesella dallaii TaxID=48710 RepID=A0ABP1R364_9HEXA